MDAHVDQVVEYILECLKHGLTDADIRAQLVENGWPEHLIDQAFEQHHKQGALPLTPEPEAMETPVRVSSPEEQPAPAANPHPISATPIKDRRGKLRRLLTKRVMIIVGGILAVILVIVLGFQLFIAPASKANANQTEDARAIWKAVEAYAGGHKGAFPESVAAGTEANTLDICGKDCSGSKQTVQLKYFASSGDAVSMHGFDSNLRVPDNKTAYIVPNSACKADGSGGIESTNGQKFSLISVVYANKSGAQQCISS